MASMMYRSHARLISQIVRRDRNSAKLLSKRELSYYHANFSLRFDLKSFTRNPHYYSVRPLSDKSLLPSSEAELESIRQLNLRMSPKIMCHTQYHSIIDYFVEKGDIYSIEQIMAEMNRNGLPPSITTINKLLSAYATNGDGTGAQSLFDEIQSAGIATNTESAGLLMKAYANQGDFSSADKVLHNAMASGVTLDIGLMNHVMRTNVISKNPAGAESVLSGIYELGLEPNQETMNLLMMAYASVGDVDATTYCLTRCKALGIEPNTAAINSILTAIINAPGVDLWESIVACHAEYFAEGKLVPNHDTYVQFLLACGKYSRTDDALFWFDDYLSSGKRVTSALRSAFRLVVGDEVYSQHPGRHNYDEKILDSTINNYRSFLEDKVTAKSSDRLEYKGNSGDVYNVVMKSNTVPVDTPSMNAVVRDRVTIGDIDGARYSMFRAANHGVYADDETILYLIGAHASHGDVKNAEEVFTESRRRSVSKQDIHVMNQIMRAYGNARNPSGANEIRLTMTHLDVKPNDETIQFLLMAYANSGDFAGLETVLQECIANGYVPSTICGNYALKALIMSEKDFSFEDFLEVYNSYFGPSNLTVDSLTYAQLLLACEKFNRFDEAIILFDELILSGLEVAPIVMNLFRKVIDSEEIMHLYPDITDKWLPEKPDLPATRGFDGSPIYQNIWGSTQKTIRRNTIAKPTAIRKLPLTLVCGVDTDVKSNASYGGDLETVLARITAREKAGTIVGSALMVQLIQAYSKVGDPASAWKALLQKEEEGLWPERATYSAMSSAFSKEGDFEGAEMVYQRGMAKLVPPGSARFLLMNEIVRAHSVYGHAENAEKALDAFGEIMLRCGMDTFHHVMMSYASLGRPDGTGKVYQKLLTARFHPSVITVNIMLAGLVHTKDNFDMKVVLNFYTQYFINDVHKPDRFTYATLLLASEKSVDRENLVLYLNKFLATGDRLTVAMRNTAMRTLGSPGFETYVSGLTPELQEMMAKVDEVETALFAPKVFPTAVSGSVVEVAGTTKRLYIPRKK